MGKLQVFISSTYEDLKDVRRDIITTILRLGHIPTGMEFFEQDDRGQMPVIKEFIDACDVFLIVIGNCYGTICGEEGKSYIQLEYEYAKQKNKKMIKIILRPNETKSYEYSEKLTSFINFVRDEGLVPPITNQVNLGAELTQRLNQYEKECSGWVRGSDNNVYKQKYELMQYLFFNSDRREGYNRFNVLPKMLMRMDMEQKYNQVRIDRLNIFYTILYNEKNKEFIYDCTRKWQMNTVHNNCNHPIDTYYFYTATDIGDRHNPKLRLMNSINGTEYSIDDDTYRNNGISCWIWNIEPVVNGGDLFNDMRLSEEVNCAWDFTMHQNKATGKLEHNQEVIYFIPRNFADVLGVIQFDICVDENIPNLDIKLYEIKSTDNGVGRRFKKSFEDRGTENGQRNYHLQWNNVNDDLDMDAVYYAVLKMVE